MKKTLAVLLAEKQTLARQTLRRLLDKQPGIRVVGEAGSASEAVALAAALKPDVVLLDLAVSRGEDGDAVKLILHASHRAKVLVMSDYEDETYVAEASRSGTAGYVFRMQPLSCLARSVRECFWEAAPGSAKIRRRPGHGAERMGRGDSGFAEPLTIAERKVMALLGRGKSRKEIAMDLGRSVQTIRTHINTIFQKLAVSNKTEATLAAISRGIISPRP